MDHRIRGSVAALAAAVTVAAMGLTSCGSANAGGGDLHVLIGTNPSHAAAQRAWVARIEQEFKAKTGHNVVFDTFSSAGDEQTKIQTSMVSGTGPDVYSLGTTFAPVAYATGGFHVLSTADWQKIGGRNKFMPASLAMSGPDAQHDIAVPTALRPFGMVYNTDMFKAAGIAAAPTSWDEFLADANKVTNPAAGTYGTAMDYSDGYDPWKYIWTLALESGGRLINDGSTKAELNSPQVVTAVNQYFGLLTNNHVTNPASVGWKAPQATAAFVAGKAAMLPMVTSEVENTLDKTSMKGKYAFAPMPLTPFGASTRPANGIAAGSIVSGDIDAIASYSKNTDLALDYLSLLTSPQEQEYYYRSFGDIPSGTAADDALAKTDPRVSSFVAAENTSVPTSFTGAWADVQLGLTNVVTQSLPGLAGGHVDPSSVQSLLAKANQTLQSSIDRQRH